MKQKSQNRFLAALLAVAMMLQMLPMLAFAEDALGTGKVRNKRTGTIYTSLVTAVQEAWSGDTIELGEGNYTLFEKNNNHAKAGNKDLTFVGQGPEVTTWIIGAMVPNPALFGSEYNGDYSFDGAGKITFKNMKLLSDDKGYGKAANYLGFIRPDQTVVDHCVINGKTFYWGYTSAVFTDTTFNAPSEDYAIWTYSSPTMIFDNCTFNTTGKAINVYADYEAGSHDIRVNFNNCTVNSSILNKQALNINDSNMRPYKYIIHIDNPQTIDAALSNTTCSQLFGFKEDKSTGFTGNTGYTDVYLGGDLVWTNGKMKTHSYTVGEKEDAYEITGRSDWTPSVERVDECEVTKTCKYCGWTKKEWEYASVYRLQYNLNEGVGAENVDYSDANYRQNESVKLEAAPTREGYQFAGWLSLKGKLYNAGDELELTGDEVFTAQWKKDEPVVNHTLTVTGGTFAVKNGDIDVTNTLETSTDEASGKQTCLVPDGAEVTVTLDQTKVPEGMVFDLWSTGKFELPLDQDYKAESITFTMNDDVDVAAQYRSADIEDGSDVVGPIIVGTAVVAGGALVGYTLGTDLVGQMWGLPYFPSNRSALAMMLWEDAGKPMPESEILYPDVGQEEQDMDLQHAARWSMEHDLMPDLNDQDTELPPEQVKFYPDNMVTKISVLRAWKKAQDLKQNAQ